MNEIMTSILVVAAQFGAIIVVVFLISIVFLYLRRRKESGISQQFTQQFRESTMARRETLGQDLSTIYGVNDETAEQFAKQILSKERLLCSNVLKVFRGKDKSLILGFQDELTNLTDTYNNLARSGELPETGTADSQINEKADQHEETQSSELILVREENARLKEDLKKALESIDYLQQQYTDLFDKTKHK